MRKNKNIQKLKIKEETGAIATFVVVTIFFFVVILMGAYMSATNLRKAQLESDIRIQQVYGSDVDKVESIYTQIAQNDTVEPNAYIQKIVSSDKKSVQLVVNCEDFSSGVDYVVLPDGTRKSLASTYSNGRDISTKILIMEDRFEEKDYAKTFKDYLAPYFANVTYNNTLTADQIIASDYDVVISHSNVWATARATDINKIYAGGKNIITNGNENASSLDIISSSTTFQGPVTTTKILNNEVTNQMKNTYSENDSLQLIKFRSEVEKWYTATANGSTYDSMGHWRNSAGTNWIHIQGANMGREQEAAAVVYRAAGNKRATYTVSQNGTYIFTIVDKKGNTATKSVQVTEIS